MDMHPLAYRINHYHDTRAPGSCGLTTMPGVNSICIYSLYIHSLYKYLDGVFKFARGDNARAVVFWTNTRSILITERCVETFCSPFTNEVSINFKSIIVPM